MAEGRDPNRRSAGLRAALFVAAMALSVLPTRAFAGCEDVDALLDRAYPKAVRGGDGIDVEGAYPQHATADEVACKVWPADPGLTLLAVPLVEAGPGPDGDTRGDVEVLVLDSRNGRPLARRLEKDMAFSDAIRFVDVTFDTARYDIRTGVRAFGLRTEQGGSSRVNPFVERALWLYTFEDGRIARVLDGLIVERTRGENDGNCDGGSETVRRAVSLGAPGRDGTRDLVVDQTESSETSKMVDGECRSTETTGTRTRQVLHFAGKRYEAPAGLRTEPESIGGVWFSWIMTPGFGPVPPGKAAAPASPSFDCAKASSKVEKAICASAPLAKADAEVDALYRERRRGLDPAAADLLAQDERYFIAARERVFGYGMGEDESPSFLLDVLEGRANFLRGLQIPSGNDLAGTWSNVAGLVTIAPSGGDRFDVDVNGNEPVTARWVCDTHGTGRLVDGVLEVGVYDGSSLRLKRDGQTLSVEAVPPPGKGAWTPDYCGLNGSVEGSYFAAPPSK